MSYEVSEIHLVKKRKRLEIAGLKTITTVPSSTMNLFRNLALQLFSRLRKADPSYVMKFYFTSLTFLSFFYLSLGRNASMRINKLVSKEN